MRKFTIIFAASVFFSGPVQSQEVEIRSGDHPTFSRITFPLEDSQTWSARQTREGIEISLPGFAQILDASNVFLRMKNTRISRINIEKESIFLQVECECNASAFRSGPLLVIDVADSGTNLYGSPIERIQSSTIIGESKPNNYSTNSDVILPWIGGASFFGPVPDLMKSEMLPVQADPKIQSADISLKSRNDLLKEVQRNLAQEIGNAASIGLLESRLTAPRSTEITKAQSGGDVAIAPKDLPNAIETASNNMRVTSSLDRPSVSSNRGLDATSFGLTCPVNDLLEIDTWGKGSDFSMQIGKARTQLVDARDQVNSDAVKHLAQMYIYFGFGAEALNTLRLDPVLLVEFPHLVDVAKILENGELARPNSVSEFTDCSSNVALWATISFNKIPKDYIVNTDAVLLALNQLPAQLRQLVAPILSSRFLTYGDAQAAAAAMRSIGRLPSPSSPESLMATANLAIKSGEPAALLLDQVINTNTVQSPTALIKLVDEKRSRGEPVSPETTTLVGAYAQELRGTELGNQLQQTEVITLGQSGRFAEAFEALAKIEPALSFQTAADLKYETLDQLTLTADSFDFLKYAFAEDILGDPNLPNQTAMRLATRLLDLGFGAQAQRILLKVPDAPRRPEKQILVARAALLLRQPFQAQAALIGVEGSEAELILAEAKTMSGSYREASEIYMRNNEKLDAARTAWLSDDWRDLDSLISSNFGAVATLSNSAESTPRLGPLGQANTALEESGSAREILRKLLDDPTLN